jgi:hypothetical protein
MLAAATLLASVMLGAGGAAASAEEAPEPTPSPSQSVAPSPSPTPPPAGFSLSSPSDGDFLQQNSVTVDGGKLPGSGVTVTVGSSTVCTVDASANTDWACAVTLPNGPGILVTATETLADATPGGQDSVTVDVLGRPTLASSPPQPSPGVATGTGYKGSIIKLLIGGAEQACNAPVTDNGQWLCTIAGGPGEYQVQAIQTTSWGTSLPSAQRTIVVNPASPTDPPAPVDPPTSQPAPVVPPPAPPIPDDDTPEPPPTPSPTPSDRADGGTLPWLDRPIFPGPSGKGPTIREALTNWGTPTGFGSALPSPGDTVAGSNWLWAPLFALAFIGLIAVPLRLLASTLRGRVSFRRPQLAGRNRGTIPADDPIPRNPWLMGSVPLAVTAGLIVLAEGLNGEVRYVRLLFAVGVGLAILNVVGVAISSRLASGSLGVSGRLRFLPLLLVIAAIATLIARFTGMEPPLVGGVLITAGFALAVPVKPRALVGLSQVGGMLILALLAWVAHSVLGAVEGFWASVLSEALATVCLAGLGSALILMLPISALPGRVVLEWSHGMWFAATVVTATVAAAVLLPGLQPAAPMLTIVLVVVGFAAVCVAVWAWANYVEVSRA